MALIRAILEALPDGVLVVNAEGIIVSYNHRFIQIWDLHVESHRDEFGPGLSIGSIDEPILAMVSERVLDKVTFLARVKELYNNPDLSDLCEIELKDGRILERHSSVLWSSDHAYLGRVWFFRDITTHKKIETELVKLTRHDPLTTIANRRYFYERAAQELLRAHRYQTPLSIISIDIDHFKLINDKYGHAVGDKILKFICANIQCSLRSTELFARIGGEEFAILVPDIKLPGALLLAERIRHIVAEHKLLIRDEEIGCTISLGVSALRQGKDTIDDCMNRADQALYKSKNNGRNQVQSEV
jgi:diguanylate cyclase (GGDEF)-like protein